LIDTIKKPVTSWKGRVVNDFEKSVFEQFFGIKEIKDYLYEKGAVYASMSGSGSSVYGFFKEKPELKVDNAYLWIEKF
jgi:4-diphosphocytidyl-2-C-methyl-D-erythritol kinase